jgi:hypothetical protein
VQIERLMDRVDNDSDGNIDYNEFMDMFNKLMVGEAIIFTHPADGKRVDSRRQLQAQSGQPMFERTDLQKDVESRKLIKSLREKMVTQRPRLLVNSFLGLLLAVSCPIFRCSE